MSAVTSNVQAAIDVPFEPGQLRESRYEGWIAERMQINVERRLLRLDLDMLLEPFVNRPGKQWWAGEHIGKFLHAATVAWEFTGDDRLRSRLDYAVNKLVASQLPNGYLGTYQESDQFASGDGLGWDGPVWDVWTHKYVLLGLLTYYQATGHEAALAASRLAADLMFDLFVVKRHSLRLASAHMGMAATSVLEPITRLYRLTGEPRYLEFCRAIVKSWDDESNPETWMYEDGCQLLTSLLEHGNAYKTANRKAYEMLSNLVGLLELYQVDPDPRYLQACLNAWDDISTRRLYLTGTASYFEQFTQDDRLPPGAAVGEGCVTVTWMQLTSKLLALTGAVRYADALERTVYNALLAAQSPQTGEVSYFVPLLGHKDYNGHDVKLTPAISCCSSSIPRGIALIPTIVAGVLNGNPTLMQYVPGQHALHYKRDGKSGKVLLQVQGNYPESGRLEIEVELEYQARFSLVLRVPPWATGFRAAVDGVSYTCSEDQFVEIERTWLSGDRVHVEIPLEIRTIPHNDKTLNLTAFARGPQVLALDSGTKTKDEAPSTIGCGAAAFCHVAKQHGGQTEFRLVAFADAGQNKENYAVLHEGIEESLPG